jgi:hypothetical protein
MKPSYSCPDVVVIRPQSRSTSVEADWKLSLSCAERASANGPGPINPKRHERAMATGAQGRSMGEGEHLDDIR